MPTPFFGLNFQTGSTPQVKRYTGLSLTAVGNAFGTAETDLGTCQPLNRVIQFGSQNTFLALVSYKIWRSTDAGVTWTNVYSLPSPSATPGQNSGLNVIYSNGIPRVCVIWSNVSINITGAYSTDGITWTQDGTASWGGGVTGWIKDTIYRNTLFVNSNDAGAGITVAYTPGTIPTVIPAPGNYYATTVSLCVFNDTLVLTGRTNTSAARAVWSLEGGGWQSRVTLTTGTLSSTGKTGMFVDSNSGELIVFNRKTIPGAWGCWKVDSSFAAVDISTTVLPFAMLTSSGGTARVLTFVDGEATPGSNPDKYIIYADGEEATVLPAMYKWMGTGTTMNGIDSGGSNKDALTLSNNCQGVGNWSSGENSIEILNRTPTSGGVILTYKAYGGGSVNIRGWFATQLEEYETHAATLLGPTAITADGFSRQITWNNAADGIATGSRFRMILEVYV